MNTRIATEATLIKGAITAVLDSSGKAGRRLDKQLKDLTGE